MPLIVLNRPNSPPQIRSRPARLALAGATGLTAALALLALSFAGPARADTPGPAHRADAAVTPAGSAMPWPAAHGSARGPRGRG